MLSLRRINVDNFTVDQAALAIHESNGIVLEYSSLENFKTNFNKYYLLLDDFKDKIKAVSSFPQAVHEHDIYMISKLEDKLNIPINSLFIPSQFEFSIKHIAEFYFDDINDGSFEMSIVTTPRRNPITIMEWILCSNLNGGVNIGIDMETINPIWLETEEIFNSIYPYVNSFCYKEYIQVVK